MSISNTLLHSVSLQNKFITAYEQFQLSIIISGTGTGNTITCPMLIQQKYGGRVICTLHCKRKKKVI